MILRLSWLLLFGSVLLTGTGRAHDPNLKAITEYNALLEMNPDDLDALRARGSTFRALEYYDSALVDLLHAEELDPDHAETLAEIGFCYYHLGDPEKATAYLERADKALTALIKEDGAGMEKHAALARELYQYRFHNFIDLGRFPEALAESERVAPFLSGQLSFLCDRADVLFHLERFKEALSLYQQALETNPAFERYCVGVVSCLIRVGRAGEGLPVFDAWLREDPSSSLPRLHRARLLKLYLNNPEAAAALLDQAEAAIRPRVDGEKFPDLEDLVILARILYEKGKFQEAYDLVTTMLEDFRGHWLVVHLQSLNARALGREQEADSFAREATLYRRMNPMDWLQAFEIPMPIVEKAAPTESARALKPPSSTGIIAGILSAVAIGIVLVLWKKKKDK